jgi:carboxymethylenebutenolidase
MPGSESAPASEAPGDGATTDADGSGEADPGSEAGAAGGDVPLDPSSADPGADNAGAADPGADNPGAEDPGAEDPAVDDPAAGADEAPGGSAAERAAISGPGQGLPTQEITFAGPRGPLQGAFASPAEPRGAVLVIHENRGLNDHIRTIAGRFARAGYAALALDLLSEEGGTASLGDSANATAALGNAAPERFVADMQACLDELERRAPGAPIGAVGFCFGGGMMWRLIATGDPRLAAAAPFYGALPGGADFNGSSAAVLAFYGENDARIIASRVAGDAAL